MTELTARHQLPLLQPGQAQKEMSHNEALTLLDLMVQPAMVAIADTPPASPQPGQCWRVGSAPMGAWAGKAGQLAGWTDGGWRFVQPREGLTVWIEEGTEFATFYGGDWHAGELRGRVFVEGLQVVGKRFSRIAEPQGGSVVDAPARAAIVAVLNALRAHGLIDPT
ncbi:DUF2793 domain-containing protein [Sphingomonas sp. CJ20]